MMKKVVSTLLVAALAGTAACAPRSGSTGSSLAYVGAGLAATGGAVALMMAESSPSGGGGGGLRFDGLAVIPGVLLLVGAGTISATSGVIALLSPRSAPSNVLRESGPPIPTTDERVAHWTDVARHMAASRQCAAAGRMLAFIAQRRPGADVSLRAELSPSCPRLGGDTLPSVAE